MVRHIVKRIIFLFLKTASRFALALHKPTTVAITGSVGKTSTKDMVTTILAEADYSVRGSLKSYNSELGVPLSILGIRSGHRNPCVWMCNILKVFVTMFYKFPKVLVLEVGVDKPGDMSVITNWLKPDISLLTLLPEYPVHAENFPGKDELYKEKIELLTSTKPSGVALYNPNDSIQKKLLNPAHQKNLKPFIRDDYSDVQENIHFDTKHNPIGTDVVLTIRNTRENFYIPEVLGGGVVQSLVAAIAVVLEVDPHFSVSVMRKAIASQKPTPGRMRILPGINGSILIDDSYNASPVAVEKAIQTVSMLHNKRKVLILGTMAELGEESEKIHDRVGRLSREIGDVVYFIGEERFGKGERTKHFPDIDSSLQSIVQEADSDTVFLCKGSQVSRIEKVVKALLHESIDSADTLVRQEHHWLL